VIAENLEVDIEAACRGLDPWLQRRWEGRNAKTPFANYGALCAASIL